MSRRGVRTLLLLACAATTACSTAPRPVHDPLPFHVALAPLEEVVVERAPGASGMPLELLPEDLERLREELAEALAAGAFARVSLVDEAPFEDPVDPLGALLRRARERTAADLVMTLELRRGTRIHHEVGPQRSNWMPWWLPGPWFWWLPDIAYGADLVLVARVHDLARPPLPSEELELRRWSFAHAHAMRDVELRFTERAGDAWSLYLLSLVVPSTAVARTREGLERELPPRFTQALAAGLAEDLLRVGDDLVRADETRSFHLVPASTRLEWTPEGRLLVRLGLAHRVGSTSNQPSALGLAFDEARPRLAALGQEEVDAAFRGRERGAGDARYELVRELEVPPGARHLRVHVRAGRAVSAVRRYTLALPPRTSAPPPTSSPARP